MKLLARRFLALLASPWLADIAAAHPQAASVRTEHALVAGSASLDRNDAFGMAAAALGDLDGDGIGDVAVGAPQDADGGAGTGAVWIHFLAADGEVRARQKIGASAGGLVGPLQGGGFFGSGLAGLGDLDGDGVVDLAVGQALGGASSSQRGAVWILFLHADGTVKAERKIESGTSGFVGPLQNGDQFGWSLANLGDLDGDGVVDLAVGAPGSDQGASTDPGASWVLFLDVDGTVQAEHRVGAGFGGTLDALDRFGSGLAGLGDLDGDGLVDLAVGAPGDDDGGVNLGAAWILFLNADGSVKTFQKISETAGGFTGGLASGGMFGTALTSLGDLDGDGVLDLAVGAPVDPDGGSGKGAVWIVFLDQNGTVHDEQKISELQGGLGVALDGGGHFGTSVASLDDLDGDGFIDLVVGDQVSVLLEGAFWVLELDSDGTVDDRHAHGDPLERFGLSSAAIGDLNGDGHPDLAVGASGANGGRDRGMVWILFLDGEGAVLSSRRIDLGLGGFGGTLEAEDRFGWALASLGDLDGDGVTDLAVGADGDDDGGADRGAVWILFLNADGTVKGEQKISATSGGFGGTLANGEVFGRALATLGDLNGDGHVDLAVGTLSDDGGTNQGGVWILFLDADGTVLGQQEISETSGGFGGVLDPNDAFGCALAGLGDLDEDGVEDLAVGALGDDDGGSQAGAVWVLFLHADGTVKSWSKIGEAQGGFLGALDPLDFLGNALASRGDLNGDGIPDLAVGARGDDDGGSQRGAVWMLFLARDGSVKSDQKLSDLEGGFGGELLDGDRLGASLAFLGDLDGDGVQDLAVGADGDDEVDGEHGLVWILELNGRPGPWARRR